VNRRTLWPRILLIVGLGGTVFGAVDALEGSFLILPAAWSLW
jgi:hypothetical protein